MALLSWESWESLSPLGRLATCSRITGSVVIKCGGEGGEGRRGGGNLHM